MSEPAREGIDKRVQRSKEKVLTETYRLLTEEGLSGVSVDEVSRRCRVSKTTIYRHWPSRSALLLDACSKMGARPEPPDTGTLKGDVSALAKHLARQLQSAQWPVVFPSIIDAAERDPELAQVQAKLQAGLMAAFLEVGERARRRGDLPPGYEASDLGPAIVAPLFYRRWFSREPIDDHFLKRVVAGVIGSSTKRVK